MLSEARAITLVFTVCLYQSDCTCFRQHRRCNCVYMCDIRAMVHDADDTSAALDYRQQTVDMEVTDRALNHVYQA